MYEIFFKLMEEKGLTAYKIAKDTGISRSTLTAWKNGEYTPKIDKLTILADYFGVSVDYLLGKTTTRDPQRMDKIAYISAHTKDETIKYAHYDDESIDDIHIAMRLRDAARQNKNGPSHGDVKEANSMDLKKLLDSHSVMFYGDYELNTEEKNIIEGVIQGVLSRKKK